MIQKPSLSEDKIKDKLQKDYSLTITALDFLPVGEGSWCYKATSDTGKQFFVKLTKNEVYKPGVTVPTYLKNQLHLDFIIHALEDNKQQVIDSIEEYTIVVYPYIDATPLRSSTITSKQWEEIGNSMHQLHAASLPSELEKGVYKESFIPRWGEGAKKVLIESEKEQTEKYAKELAQFIHNKKDEITKIIIRTYELGEEIKNQQPKLVLCHSDIHTDNMLLTKEGRIYFIDWDFIQIAPIERDLMFFMGDEHTEFMKGYDLENKIVPNKTILAYYNYEWVVQEIRDYGTRIFFEDLDEKSKQHALEEFCKLFEPNNVVEAAYNADKRIDDNSYDEYLTKLHSGFHTPDSVINQMVHNAVHSQLKEKKQIMQGEMSEVYDIITENGQSVILRIAQMEYPRFEEEQWAVEKVRQVGVPAPHVFLVDTVNYDNKEIDFCVEEKLSGEPLLQILSKDKKGEDWKRNIASQAGKILAQMQSIKTDGFGELNKYGKGEYPSWEAFMLRDKPKISQLHKIAQELGIKTEYIDKAFTVLEENIPQIEQVESRLLHSDFSPKHLLVTNNTITGIVDFASIKGGDIARDFAWWEFFNGTLIPLDWVKEGYGDPQVFSNEFNKRIHLSQIELAISFLDWYYKLKHTLGLEHTKRKLIQLMES